ncbi:hypothetical protein HDU76_012667 [Blyttiomyces sp. JEL0837]|nr:hypothetical protein HDU76_012667 [Blyttiomyces sp. JEL0837]
MRLQHPSWRFVTGTLGAVGLLASLGVSTDVDYSVHELIGSESTRVNIQTTATLRDGSFYIGGSLEGKGLTVLTEGGAEISFPPKDTKNSAGFLAYSQNGSHYFKWGHIFNMQEHDAGITITDLLAVETPTPSTSSTSNNKKPANDRREKDDDDDDGKPAAKTDPPPKSHVIIAGTFSGLSLTLNDLNSKAIVAHGQKDHRTMFVAKATDGGKFAWVFTQPILKIVESYEDLLTLPVKVGLDDDGDVVVAGTFFGTLPLNFTKNSFDEKITGRPNTFDSFLLKIDYATGEPLAARDQLFDIPKAAADSPKGELAFHQVSNVMKDRCNPGSVLVSGLSFKFDTSNAEMDTPVIKSGVVARLKGGHGTESAEDKLDKVDHYQPGGNMEAITLGKMPFFPTFWHLGFVPPFYLVDSPYLTAPAKKEDACYYYFGGIMESAEQKTALLKIDGKAVEGPVGFVAGMSASLDGKAIWSTAIPSYSGRSPSSGMRVLMSKGKSKPTMMVAGVLEDTKDLKTFPVFKEGGAIAKNKVFLMEINADDGKVIFIDEIPDISLPKGKKFGDRLTLSVPGDNSTILTLGWSLESDFPSITSSSFSVLNLKLDDSEQEDLAAAKTSTKTSTTPTSTSSDEKGKATPSSSTTTTTTSGDAKAEDKAKTSTSATTTVSDDSKGKVSSTSTTSTVTSTSTLKEEGKEKTLSTSTTTTSKDVAKAEETTKTATSTTTTSKDSDKTKTSSTSTTTSKDDGKAKEDDKVMTSSTTTSTSKKDDAKEDKVTTSTSTKTTAKTTSTTTTSEDLEDDKNAVITSTTKDIKKKTFSTTSTSTTTHKPGKHKPGGPPTDEDYAEFPDEKPVEDDQSPPDSGKGASHGDGTSEEFEEVDNETSYDDEDPYAYSNEMMGPNAVLVVIVIVVVFGLIGINLRRKRPHGASTGSRLHGTRSDPMLNEEPPSFGWDKIIPFWPSSQGHYQRTKDEEDDIGMEPLDSGDRSPPRRIPHSKNILPPVKRPSAGNSSVVAPLVPPVASVSTAIRHEPESTAADGWDWDDDFDHDDGGNQGGDGAGKKKNNDGWDWD